MAAQGVAASGIVRLSDLELGAGVGLRTGCISGDLSQVGVTGKHISAYSWRQVNDEVTGE